VLDSIVEGVRIDLAGRKSLVSAHELRDIAQRRVPARNAVADLAKNAFSVIAEVKRASPSKGDLAPIADPAALAAEYQAGGAGAVSVLTEARRFGGSLADLEAVRDAVTVPVLRKDFMVDEYQVIEARAYGADIILLIVAGLDDHVMADLAQTACDLGMSVLFEVHDEHELERAMALQPGIVGVNARNLKTLDVDLAVCERLLPRIPAGIVAVAESGIATVHDVQRVAAAGATAVLVGEALVQSVDPTATIRQWIAVGEGA
jgi:indole-3-glycerol phosphate synthase